MDLIETLTYLDPESNPKNYIRYDGEPFTKNYIVEHKNKVSIRGKISFSGFEQFGIFVIYMIGPLIIYYLPLRGSIGTIIKLVFIILSFFITRIIANKYFSIKFLEINKETKELKSPLDGFTASLSDIHELSIIEEDYHKQGKELMRYRISFTLPTGEKNSIFTFISYNSAEEILEAIKNS